MLFVEQNINFKTKRNRKWKIPHTLLERRALCFSSYKKHKLIVKLWWVGARKRKKYAFSETFILSEENFCSLFISLYYFTVSFIVLFYYIMIVFHYIIIVLLIVLFHSKVYWISFSVWAPLCKHLLCHRHFNFKL